MRRVALKSIVTALALFVGQMVHAEPRGTLHMVVQFPPPSLGLPYTANGMPSSFYWHALFDSLTEWSLDGKLVPALAISWEQRDPLNGVFYLRPALNLPMATRLLLTSSLPL